MWLGELTVPTSWDIKNSTKHTNMHIMFYFGQSVYGSVRLIYVYTSVKMQAIFTYSGMKINLFVYYVILGQY